MKKRIAIILILVITISCMTLAFASCNRHKPEKDVFVIEGNTVVGLTDYGKTQSNVVIPNGISSIKDFAFSGCENLISVRLPDSVNSIGLGAFLSCYNLREVNIPSGVTEIREDTFYFCLSLVNVNIPNTVTQIDSDAFAFCMSLTDLVIPNSVSNVDSSAFNGCLSLIINFEDEAVSFDWLDELQFLAEDYEDLRFPIVYNCKNNDTADDGYIYLVAENGIQYAIKDGVAKVTGHSYIDKDLVIDESITYNGVEYPVIEIDMLSLCLTDIKALTIPGSVKKIGAEAVSMCLQLERVDMSIGVEAIGENAFCLDVELTNIAIPNTLDSIGEGAFSHCSSIMEIFIPISVKKIGKDAFEGCDILEIYCEAENEPTGWYMNWNKDNCPVVWGHKIK